VARPAFLLRESAVIALFLDNILGDVLVAVQAQGILRRFLETRVAALAVSLDVCMAFNDLARHEHTFDRFGTGDRRKTSKKQS
jgi:hypothetical protein